MSNARRLIRFSAEVSTLGMFVGTLAAATGHCPLTPLVGLWLWFTLAWIGVASYSEPRRPASAGDCPPAKCEHRR
jgi:hypothetical protein